MNTTRNAYRWVILILLVLGTAILNYSNIVFAVRAADIMKTYGCSSEQLAAIVSVSLLPGAVLSVFFGRLMDKHGSKFILVVCMLLTATMFFMRTMVSSYWPLFIFTLLSGIFLVPTGVAPAKVLFAWFDEREMPLAMGIYASAAGFGSAVGYATSVLFPTVRGSLWLVTIAAAALAILWAVLGRNTPKNTESRTQLTSDTGAVFKKLLRSRNLWCLMVCSFIACGVSLTLNTYLSRALGEIGGDSGATAVIGAVLNICMVLGGAVIGAVISRLQLFNAPYLTLCVVGGGMLLLAWFLPFGPATYIFFPLAALLLSGAVGLNMTRITLLPLAGDYGPEDIATANGMCNTALCLGGFVIPIAVSAAAGENYTAVFAAAFVLFAVSGAVGIIVPELGARG